MKDLSRVKKDKKGYYIEYIHKTGKQKGQVLKTYGQIREHCPVCNEPFFTTNNTIKEGYGKSCSISCSITGKNSRSYKGGRIKNPDGYIRIYMPEHPHCYAKGYVYEHRLVMEKHLGRYLKPEEVVHHRGIRYPIDSIENKQDNQIENLKLFKNQGEHVNGKNHSRQGVIKMKREELIKKTLDLIRETDEEILKKWIFEQWSHGYGLID